MSSNNQPRLLLINPVNPARTGLTINESSRFPPLGLGIIAALTPDNWGVTLIDENWETHKFQPADLVGITAFTASACRAYAIASEYRRAGIPVVLGGIHASMCPQEALRYVDAVVIGEAEAVWPQVLEDFRAGRMKQIYRGEWQDLTQTVVPRRSLFHPGYNFASIQTSRGCPMNCDFCSVTAFNGRRYRRRPPEDVLAELETIPQKMLFFVDDNIIGYSREDRETAKTLFREMADHHLDKLWFCQASINFADDEELLYWAGKAGCKMVFLGLEAEHDQPLREVKKKLNLSRGVDSYREAFRRIHKAGIAVLGAFIFGMDSDTPGLLDLRTRYMIRSDVDVMQTTTLTPLPGTDLFARLEEEARLLYTNHPEDWDHFDMTEVTYQPAQMSPAELSESTIRNNRKMYAAPVLARKALRTFLTTRDPMAAMFAWHSNQNYRNVALHTPQGKR
ncbi:MAG: B12-binding domain-containing radical SAM protein [Anaerolineales bacterium]|nr:B12-binding domain-containing radical SAM protein [Anaerolineales bacterium]